MRLYYVLQIDLKEDHCITFEQFFPHSEDDFLEQSKEDAKLVKFSRITSDLANKLATSQLDADGQWFTLLSLYIWECEQIKRIFRDNIRSINNCIDERNRVNIRGNITLGPFKEVLIRYKGGKYANLFSEVDVDLRNAFVHGSFDFSESNGVDKVTYAESEITTAALLQKYRKVAALFAILFGARGKSFADEFKARAEQNGIQL